MKTIYTPTEETLNQMGFGKISSDENGDTWYSAKRIKCIIDFGEIDWSIGEDISGICFYPESRKDIEALIRLLTP